MADPPPTPATGARYIIGAAPTGHWAGHDSEIAVWDGMIWRFVMPQPGWRADVSPTGQSLRFDGSDWQTVLPQLQNLPALGVGATADASNPLTVAAAATLLTHTGAGHQLKLNKSGASDTTSLLFQTSWSGRAEMGTTGSDDFSIKVSSDGSNWQEALHIAGTTGQVHFPQGSPDLRDRLTAPRTYYVRPDGSDTNTGLSDAASGAFLTLQHAVNQALSLDNGLHDVTLQVADGSYGEDLVIADRLLGSGLLQLIGETADPSLVSLNRITCHNGARVALAGVTLTGADALKVESGAAVTLADIHFEGSGAALSLESAEVSCADQALVLGSNLTALAHLRGHARLWRKIALSAWVWGWPGTPARWI
ncbi:DUF2793 domain-containing protein (plasmid) [Parasedimentitalea marina]|uniref:DUF2793 domain-containing protein n=1 Tax=Parasedimentitalea marina TaxID=2483033 RepID=A0A3T0N978_9RHOB|nr:DUF2793 domain-containing protein [Parasedimentitalea marina]AZV80583.1 DUF2793 domain-containing protein [Parasedimentitalea marina]